MLRWRPLVTGLIVLGAWGASSCSPADFQSSTVIDTVRILASRASEPHAKPGDEVTLDVLAIDPRNDGGATQVYWLPILCVNPKNDAYYACFASLANGGGDAGVVLGESAEGGAGESADAGRSVDAGGSVDAGVGVSTDAGVGAEGGVGADAAPGVEGGAGPGPDLAALLRPGVDLTPFLVHGSSLRFTVPTDVIIPRKGIQTSYGLVIAFNFACAGKTIELLPFDPGDPQQLPIGCFDANHNQLGPDDFVFGFTRVYAYEDKQKLSEENPPIQWVDTGNPSHQEKDGLTLDAGVSAPFRVPLCASPDGGGCPENAIGPFVPSSNPPGKQVWADFYSTVGTFDSTARLLYDPAHKLSIPSDTDNRYVAPTQPSKPNFIWIVVHDDQGGANWVTVPLTLLAPDGGTLLGPDGGPL